MLYRCKNCGGNVVYDPAGKMMKCLSCGGNESQEMVPSTTPWTCTNCGSQIPFSQYASASRCKACGTYVIRDDFVAYPYGADKVIPFKVTKHEAEEALIAEFGKKLFLPSTFLSEKTLEQLRGMYVPFWLYDYDTDIAYTATGTKVRSWTTGNTQYTETSYYHVARDLHIDYAGVPVDASIDMPDQIMDWMEPYQYGDIEQHDNKFLSGFEAEIYNFPPDQLQPRALDKINVANREWLRKSTSEYSTLTQERMNMNNRPTGNQFALLPVWIYDYRYHGEYYRFFVNGQTKKCVGKAPLSLGKAIGLTSLLFASLCAAATGISLFLGVLF